MQLHLSVIFETPAAFGKGLENFSRSIQRKILRMFLLPPIRGAEIVECVRKYLEGSSQNLQSLSSY